ncbi:hypothetical protein [Flaviflexus massiliensis]|uniref:hypothetical protein n=1 Tax=Flaviflexus massiliensis TaxID=1522309 RepID=UPI0006D5AAB7|nr:hypothetical protein [Flaviflexus massiliensis]
MTHLVHPEEIETIVGATREQSRHIARAVSSEQTVYILHSVECRDTVEDLRNCDFSLALDRGINPDHWSEYEDRPVHVSVLNGQLIPLKELVNG